MEKFDRVANFVNSLERKELTENQQAMLLVGTSMVVDPAVNNCSCNGNDCQCNGNNCNCNTKTFC